MSASLRARAAAVWQIAKPWRYPFLALLALSACGSPQTAFDRQPDPSRADAAAAPANYRPVVGDYRSRRPAAPADWRGTNDGVAPKKESR